MQETERYLDIAQKEMDIRLMTDYTFMELKKLEQIKKVEEPSSR